MYPVALSVAGLSQWE